MQKKKKHKHSIIFLSEKDRDKLYYDGCVDRFTGNKWPVATTGSTDKVEFRDLSGI